ncbi:CBN-ASP-6 protein [Aphelenchoides fujianensis]|nr:CBN-ASP-6 protein [Aphelenchoides fujianensis]
MLVQAAVFFLCLQWSLGEAGSLSFQLHVEKDPASKHSKGNGTLGPLMDVFGANVQNANKGQSVLRRDQRGESAEDRRRDRQHGNARHVAAEGRLFGEQSELRETRAPTPPPSTTPPAREAPARCENNSPSATDWTSERPTPPGQYFQDFFAFGNARAWKNMRLKRPVVFGVADRIVEIEKGVLGLGLPVPEEKSTHIFEEAWMEGLLDSPVFTLFFKKCQRFQTDCQDAKTGNTAGPVIGWAPAFTELGSWQFRMSALAVNRFVVQKEVTVATNSGSPTVYFPPAVVDGIAREIGASYDGNWWKDPFDLKLVINGQTYTITKEALTFDVGNDQCLLYLDKGETTIRAPFMRSLCNVHDFRHRRVGFALPLQ